MKRFALICALLPLPVFAQSQDEGRLVRFIEDALSDGAARSVDLQGFRGALSSEASLERLTIADADGVWLEISGAVLNWNRAAVLRGEIEITALTAEQVILYRLPVAEDVNPSPEATPFSLPELPVSIAIDQAEISRLELGQPVLGTAIAASASAQVSLASGAGNAALNIDRIDGQQGRVAVAVSYDNASTQTNLTLEVSEGDGGIAATLLDIEGTPPLALNIEGDGPLDAFDASFALATDGADRLAGQASIQGVQDAGRIVTFQLGGDLRPVVSGHLETFLGASAEISAEATIADTGAIDLRAFRAQSAALDVTGSLSVDADRAPSAFHLTGSVRPPDGEERLALPGGAAEISGAVIDVGFNRAESDAVSGAATLTNLTARGFSAPQTELALQGSLTTGAFTGEFSASSEDLDHEDPAIASALGSVVSVSSSISWTESGALDLTALEVSTIQGHLAGQISAQTGEDRLDVNSDLTLNVQDLTPFGPLAGLALGGGVEAALELRLEALSGAFETVFEAEAQDLTLPGTIQDALFVGTTTLVGHIARDETGLLIDGLEVDGTAVELAIDGVVATDNTRMRFDARLEDGSAFDPRLSGPITLGGQVVQTGAANPYQLDDFQFASDLARVAGTVTAQPGDTEFPISANLSGAAALAAWQGLVGSDIGGAVDFTLSGNGDLRAETLSAQIAATAQGLSVAPLPPALLAGETELAGAVTLSGDILSVDGFTLNGRELDLALSGQTGPQATEAALTATLRDGRILSSALPGALALDATLTQSGTAPFEIDATARGPAGLRAEISGTATTDPLVDLRITGGVPLALADPFIAPQTLSGLANLDLRISGTPDPASLAGRVSIGNARLGLPLQGLALQDLTSRIDVASGSATIDLAGTLSSGGAFGVTGRLGFLDPSLPANLDIRLDQGRVIDPELFEAAVDRVRLTLSGALAGRQRLAGQIDLGVVELRVPETGVSGAGAIPDITHIGESPSERQTRLYAGLLDRSARGGGGLSSLGLDLNISAPGRMFLRGRGLDAELGGTLRLGGSASNIIPSGQFDLIRGRLSILGQRLDLTDGQVTLQGGAPYVSLTAQTRSGEYTIIISVEGDATAPAVRFRSLPELPEDEVLAQLFFGRSVSSLSAIQALQLADGVAALAGGGSGVFTRLRENLGLDDLDIQTDASGNAVVTAGRYLSENVYTDLTVDDAGTGVSINIDLTPSLTARGGVESDGSSSIGVFFERDY